LREIRSEPFADLALVVTGFNLLQNRQPASLIDRRNRGLGKDKSAPGKIIPVCGRGRLIGKRKATHEKRARFGSFRNACDVHRSEKLSRLFGGPLDACCPTGFDHRHATKANQRLPGCGTFKVETIRGLQHLEYRQAVASR
jgi:hypothetical protein